MLIKEGKTNIKYILIVVALAAFVAGLAITINYTKESSIPFIKQTPEKNEIDTSDWQTYRNEEFGFEVKYPTAWLVSQKILDNQEFGGGLGVKPYLLNGVEVVFEDPDGLAHFSIIKDMAMYSQKKERYLTFEEIVEEERRQSNTLPPKEESTVLAGHSATSIFYFYQHGRTESIWSITSIFEEETKTWINFSINISDEDRIKEETYLRMLNQILSTFWFIK